MFAYTVIIPELFYDKKTLLSPPPKGEKYITFNFYTKKYLKELTLLFIKVFALNLQRV